MRVHEKSKKKMSKTIFMFSGKIRRTKNTELSLNSINNGHYGIHTIFIYVPNDHASI